MKTDLTNLKINCPCGGRTKQIEANWKGTKIRAGKCPKCGEEIFHPLDAQKALEIIQHS